VVFALRAARRVVTFAEQKASTLERSLALTLAATLILQNARLTASTIATLQQVALRACCAQLQIVATGRAVPVRLFQTVLLIAGLQAALVFIALLNSSALTPSKATLASVTWTARARVRFLPLQARTAA